MAIPSDHDIVLALGEDLPIGLWVARAPDGELVYANRTFAEIMGTPARSDVRVGGYAASYGIHTRDGAPYPEDRMPFVRALAERRVIVADDLTIHRRDGTRVDIRAVARPVGEPVTHVIIAFFDVSREVEAERAHAESEQRLRRAQRLEAIGTLAGGIAHDFNNLIFGIKMIAAELAATEPDPKRREAIEQIDDITERSATLTRSLLGFARRGKHRASPVGVNDVVTAMSELFSRTLAGVELTFELEASERGTVVGDQSQIEQVIMNLVLNARDAVQASGRVAVRTRDLGSPSDPDAARFVVLEVADDGPGIPAEIRDRVFEPYFTTKTTGPERGTGLGLATVFGIVESHGGSVEIDAGLGGSGTTMRIVLPAASRPPPVKSRPTVADLPRGSGMILVVDDDQMVRRVVSSSLNVLGYQTVEAASGPDAVEIYRNRRGEIRAVVLDMVMPGMTGRATYLALREVDPDVAVLLMSGNTLNESVQEILDLGVRNFVTKPYSIATLAKAIAELTQ
ncbi:MAG: response regulator [Deltaproteobacteria bacterium]|nr:MAG: response regulator [Deltaproteobacteria bacterium]